MATLIKVNSKKEQKALQNLQLALGILDITLEDLKSFKEIINENRILNAENLHLQKELETKVNSDKLTNEDITAFISRKEEVR